MNYVGEDSLERWVDFHRASRCGDRVVGDGWLVEFREGEIYVEAGRGSRTVEGPDLFVPKSGGFELRTGRHIVDIRFSWWY